jgi:hypothetical protein
MRAYWVVVTLLLRTVKQNKKKEKVGIWTRLWFYSSKYNTTQQIT